VETCRPQTIWQGFLHGRCPNHDRWAISPSGIIAGEISAVPAPGHTSGGHDPYHAGAGRSTVARRDPLVHRAVDTRRQTVPLGAPGTSIGSYTTRFRRTTSSQPPERVSNAREESSPAGDHRIVGLARFSTLSPVNA
jgi:hypothetical protein